eukprot:45875_1
MIMSLLLVVVLSTFKCTIGCSVDLWDLCSFSGTKWILPSAGHYSIHNHFTNDAISSWTIYSTIGKQCCAKFWYHGTSKPDSLDITQCAVNGETKQLSCATSTNNNNQISAVTVTLSDMANPTPNPTAKPTPAPTTSPTKSPTIHPTTYPTVNPTSDPTIHPTMNPSLDPTANPTIYPTANPTIHPTTNPTIRPTMNPSPEPTVIPTTYPTTNPTTHPTVNPSVEPTMNPSIHPTVTPTIGPTSSPTASPSDASDTLLSESVSINGQSISIFAAICIMFCVCVQCVVICLCLRLKKKKRNIRKDDELSWIRIWLVQVTLPEYYDNLVSNGYQTIREILSIKTKSQLFDIGILKKGHQTLLLSEI